MIYRQLLTIIIQNENYILIKIEHPSLCGEGCSKIIIFYIQSKISEYIYSDIKIINNQKYFNIAFLNYFILHSLQKYLILLNKKFILILLF